jgi:hypothetical protein
LAVRYLVAASCFFGATASMPASAEITYTMSRCVANKNTASLAFEGGGRRVRRIHLGPGGVELSGDIKGSSSLNMVREIQVQPKLKISYVGGQIAEFGKLTNECAKKVLSTAKALSLATRGSDG